MRTRHCLCAICGGPLRASRARISATPRTAGFLRRQEWRQREGESTSGDSDPDSQYDSSEERTYDPEILSDVQRRWLDTVHAIGYNPASPHVDKVFITPPGRPSFHESFWPSHNSYRNACERFMKMYITESLASVEVYPFHWCCFELLLKTITGTTDMDQLDKDTLYNVMSELERRGHLALALDYGHPEPNVKEDRWMTRAGEEILVTNPIENPGLTEYVRASLAKHAADSPPWGDFAHLRHKVRRDPFALIPYDVLDHCVSFLPDESLFALCQASLSVNSALDGGFWAQRMRESMPWFFEALDLLQDATFMSAIDPRRMFICLDKMTQPQRGLRGVLTGIANRRRIWGVCAQLADRYHKKLPRLHNQRRKMAVKGDSDEEEEEEEEEAQSIMANATIPNMPRIREDPYYNLWVRKGQKKQVNTISTQWIRAWEEVGAPGTAVETAWNKHNCFTGMAVEIRGELRRFGSGWKGEVCRRELPAGVWIDGLILYITYMTGKTEKTDKTGKRRRSLSPDSREGYYYVAGVEVSCNDGSRIAMGCCEPKHMMRPLIVGDKMVVVGLTGKSVNGKITRMGLLEHSRLGAPFNHHQRDPKPHLAREFLWENDAHEQLRGRRIWELQSLHLSVPGEEWLDQPLINTMIPFQALFWGTSEEELQKLCRLSWHIAIEREGRRYEKWSLREVKAQYTQPGPESRCLKLEGDKGEDHDAVYFEIDGAGGERVTGVEAKGTSTLKLHTNRDREILWGDDYVGNWATVEVPAGDTIVGIAIQQCRKWGSIGCLAILSMPL